MLGDLQKRKEAKESLTVNTMTVYEVKVSRANIYLEIV